MNVWEGNDRNYGETGEYCTRTMHQPLPLPKDQVSVQRNPFCVSRKCESKNGSKTAVRWTKRMSQLIVFRPFAMHWEWTRFVEFDNYLWWNLGIYVWSGNQATINAVEVNIISKTKKSMHELFKVQGHVDCFLWYSGYCDGRVGTQRQDDKSLVLHWSLDEIAWTCEKETTGIMEKWVDFAPGQRASPQRIDCEAIFS